MIDEKILVDMAIKAMEKAYTPYSHFRVGAALETKKGHIYTGCNIENASFGATNCAERTAVFKCVSDGELDIERIAIASDSNNLTFPCGICRQVLSEFNPNMKVIVANRDGEFASFVLSELLPYSFQSKDMQES